MQYRSEIDGLRAVAVVPVMLFHAGFSLFSGGFVGVDVFFVISGYLITGIIYEDIQRGSFSIVRFYERRIRRILPALFVVSLACVPFAWLWMLPSEFKDLSQSLVAVNLFISNILFWKETGYFGPAAELKPLLHTWSLAVEEQFYLFFPVFLVLFRKLSWNALLSLLFVLTVLSLGLAEWGSQTHPIANFYLLPTRAWELGVGAILAISSNVWGRAEGWTVQVGSAIGLVMIFWAVFVFDETVPFQGIRALVPVLGTALIIVCARPQTVIGKMLGMKFFVGIGLISYGAYLWHYPLFAFARIRSFGEVSSITFVALGALALGLAYLSWRFVEQPFRKKGAFSKIQIFTGAVTVSTLFIMFGIVGYATSGLPGRHPDKLFVESLEYRLRVNHGLSEVCNGSLLLSLDCRTGEAPQVIVWGDSYAMHLVDGIIASNPFVPIIQMTKINCGPILEVAPILGREYSDDWAVKCIDFNENVWKWLKKNKSIKFAVLSSVFKPYLDEKRGFVFKGKLWKNNQELVLERLKKTLDLLVAKGIRPILFAPPPANGSNMGLCLARILWIGLENRDIRQCDFDTSEYDSYRAKEIRFFKEIEKHHKVIWISDLLCDEARCKTAVAQQNVMFDNTLVFIDRGHLSHEGSRYVGKAMNFFKLFSGEN